jgi:hypothetical protein
MFTDAEMTALMRRVMDRMIEARWLHSHRFTEGKGYFLAWTPEGAERAACLKRIAETFGLLDGDDHALAFDKAAHVESLDATPHRLRAPLNDTLAAYWRESIEQLGLRHDADGLLALVHIVDGWAPPPVS